MSNTDGSGFHRLTASNAIEVEAKINPKTGADLVDVSGRSGPLPQIYHMSLEGTDVQRYAGYRRSHQPGLESRWRSHRLCLDQGL